MIFYGYCQPAPSPSLSNSAGLCCLFVTVSSFFTPRSGGLPSRVCSCVPVFQREPDTSQHLPSFLWPTATS